MKVPNDELDGELADVSLSRLQNEGSQRSLREKALKDKSIKATE